MHMASTRQVNAFCMVQEYRIGKIEYEMAMGTVHSSRESSTILELTFVRLRQPGKDIYCRLAFESHVFDLDWSASIVLHCCDFRLEKGIMVT